MHVNICSCHGSFLSTHLSTFLEYSSPPKHSLNLWRNSLARLGFSLVSMLSADFNWPVRKNWQIWGSVRMEENIEVLVCKIRLQPGFPLVSPYLWQTKPRRWLLRRRGTVPSWAGPHQASLLMVHSLVPSLRKTITTFISTGYNLKVAFSCFKPCLDAALCFLT